MTDNTYTQGRFFKIKLDKLAAVQDKAEDFIDRGEAADYLINYDWANDSEHQDWLNTAPVDEIVDWLRAVL